MHTFYKSAYTPVLLCFLFHLMAVPDKAPAQITFQKMIKIPYVINPDFVSSTVGVINKDMEQTLDGGYIIFSNNSSRYGVSSNPTLTKLDKFGNKQWCKVYSLGNSADAVEPTSDSGYIAVGGAGSGAFVVKTDKMGIVQWDRTVADFNDNNPFNSTWFTSVKETKEGDFIVTGGTGHFGTKGLTGIGNAWDVFLIKYNASGTKLWAQTYGTTGLFEFGRSVIQTTDGGFMVAGRAEVNDNLNGTNIQNTGFLLKTDTLGRVQWKTRYGITDSSFYSIFLPGYYMQGDFYDVFQTGDGSYVVNGRFNEDKQNTTCVVKTDSLGDVQWARAYTTAGHEMLASVMRQTQDSGYAIAPLVFFGYPQYVPVLKINQNGQLKWARNYGMNDDVSESMVATLDSGFAVLGSTTDTLVTNNDSLHVYHYLIKTDSLGKSGTCQNTLIAQQHDITPETSSFNLSRLVDYQEQAPAVPDIAGKERIVSDACLNSPLKADFSKMALCPGDSKGDFYFDNLSVGTLFSWNFGEGALDTSSLYAPGYHTYTAPGTYTVTLTVTDEYGGNVQTVQKTVTVLDEKFYNAGRDTAICKGDTLQIITSNSLGYGTRWNPGNSLSDSLIANPLAFPSVTTTYYTFSSGQLQTDGPYCYQYDTLTVTVNFPLVNAGADVSICAGDSAFLQGTGAITYAWSPAEGLSSVADPVVSAIPAATTDYILTGTDENGCKHTDSVTVAVNALPTFSVAPADTTILSGNAISLSCYGNAGAYSWSTGENTSSITLSPADSATYCVTLTDANGCQAKVCVSVNVITCNQEVFIPDAFSPNNDGINDILFVKNECIDQLVFKIYDRWGNTVFLSANMNEGWDGMYKGEPMDPGVFVYYVNAITLSGKAINGKGNVSLIR